MEIQQVGLTIEKEGEVSMILEGEMPPDCVVVFMSKASFLELKEWLKSLKETE